VQIKSVKLVSAVHRPALIAAALAMLLGVVFSVKWHVGNSVADSARQFDAAEVAVFLAPSDPLAHAKLATLKSQNFVPTALPEALVEYEKAVALSPHDWRYWYGLGRMRERNGDGELAESAARRSVELAPNYAQNLWLYGNILLRRGNTNEAFTAMRRAAESDSNYAVHFVNSAAQILKTDDLDKLRQAIGDSPQIRSALTTYLTQDKKFDAAVRVWQDLPAKEKEAAAKDLSNALVTAKQYRAASAVLGQTIASEAEKPAVAKIINADFENDAINKGAFSWQIADGAQPTIAFDTTQKHGGARSLVILFNSITGQEFRAVSQTVAVESGANYDFSVFVKTSGLNAANTVFWEVVDAADGKVLAKTNPVPSGDSDWQKLTASFTTGETTQGVTIRLARVTCTAPPCSITGKIWFDDFRLVK
jgi:Tfp pilus assembly protein PilF